VLALPHFVDEPALTDPRLADDDHRSCALLDRRQLMRAADERDLRLDLRD
jgi:hypothetical protein